MEQKIPDKTPRKVAPTEVKAITGDDFIRSRILTIRGVQVMLDRDLAMLYGVTTKRLNEQVKRNAARFPVSVLAFGRGNE